VRNALTVDVEDWFHICGVEGPLASQHWERLPSRVVATTHDLLDLFDACSVRATFFILGWVAFRYPALVDRIRAAGHEIGSHGHLHQRVYELTQDGFRRDLADSRAAIAAAGAPIVRGYRAPEWSINGRSLWALDVLASEGFVFDSSMAPMKIVGDASYPQHPHLQQTASGSIHEFPPLVDRRFRQNMPLIGWGLRMSSPRRAIRTIEGRNRAGIPVALSVHPWEIDPDPPRVKLPLSQAFAHYFRLGGFRERLRQILRGASFAPMGQILGLPQVSQ
jgi:polysaccharide deacetylase family protein (PEP-CTERM system associated)